VGIQVVDLLTHGILLDGLRLFGHAESEKRESNHQKYPNSLESFITLESVITVYHLLLGFFEQAEKLSISSAYLE